MKKFVSVLISAILLLSATILPVHAEESTDIYYEVLDQLNFIPDGFEYNDEIITRGEFAALIAGLRGYDGGEILLNAYLDVEREYFLSNQINYVTDKGIFEGYPDETFRSEEELKWAEVSAVMVKALGYDAFAQQQGGYPDGYLKVASQIDVIKGMKTTSSVSKKQAVKIVYNMLNTEILSLEFSDSKSGFSYKSDQGKTPMSEWLHLEKAEGLITSVNELYITSNGAVEKSIVVGGVQYDLGENLDADDLLGYYCEIYFGNDKSDFSGEVVAAAVIDGKNDITVINTDDIISFEDGYLVHNDGRIKIPSTAEVALNGTAVKSDDRYKALTDSDGTVTVNKPYGKIETVVLINSYETYVVGGVSSNEYTVYDKLDDKRKINIDPQETRTDIKDTDGKILEFSDIALNDVLTVWKNGDGTRVKITKSSKTITGEFASYNIEDDYIVEYRVDGKVYNLAKDLIKSAPTHPAPGENVKFYLDCNDKIAYFSLIGTTSFKYGFLCKISPDEVEENVFTATLFTPEGEFVKYVTTNKLKVDGERPKTSEGVISSLERGNSDVSVYQMVRYKVNDEEKITEFDTAYRGARESANTLRISYQGYSPQGAEVEKLVYKPDNTFEHKVLIDSNTKRMTVAKSYVGNETVFKLGRTFVNGYSYAMNAYCSNEEQICPDVIIAFSETAEAVEDYVFGAVKKIEQTINVDEEPVLQLTVASRYGETIYTTMENYLLDDIDYINGKNTQPHKLKVGDYVRMHINVLNEIVDMDVLYSVEQEDWLADAGFYGSIHGDNASFGTAYKRADSVVQIALDGAVLGKDESKFVSSLRAFALGSAKVHVYDKETGKVTNATLNDICGYFNSSVGASKVVIYADGGRVYQAMIYR